MKSRRCSGKKNYLSDFNVSIDQQNSSDAIVRKILYKFGQKNHVNMAAHNLGHTLDLVVDCVENFSVGSVIVEPQKTISPGIVNLSMDRLHAI